MSLYKITVSNSGGYTFNVASDGYAFTLDLGGKGVTPPAALLASLGACVGVYLRKYAEGAKLSIRNFTVDVESELIKEPPVRFKSIKVVVGVEGVSLDEKRAHALMAFLRNCPVHNTLKTGPEIDIEITNKGGDNG